LKDEVRSRSRGPSKDKNTGPREGDDERETKEDGGEKDDEKMDVAADEDKKSEDGGEKIKKEETEALAEDFSDFGDSDDEILNQEEESREGGELRDDDSRPSSRQSRISAKKAGAEGGEREGKSLKKEEELARANAQLADALGADWSQLVAEKKEQQNMVGEARKRWSGAEIIRRIGLSQTHLGKKKYDEILSKVNKDLPEDEKVVLLDTEPGMHMTKVAKLEEKKNLICGLAPHKRALSARADLRIRRRLNGLRGTDTGLPPSQGNTNMELYTQACVMLKKAKEAQAVQAAKFLAMKNTLQAH